MRYLAFSTVAAMAALTTLALAPPVLAQKDDTPSPTPSASPLSREKRREQFADTQKKLALLTKAASLTVAGRSQDRATQEANTAFDQLCRKWQEDPAVERKRLTPYAYGHVANQIAPQLADAIAEGKQVEKRRLWSQFASALSRLANIPPHVAFRDTASREAERRAGRYIEWVKRGEERTSAAQQLRHGIAALAAYSGQSSSQIIRTAAKGNQAVIIQKYVVARHGGTQYAYNYDAVDGFYGPHPIGPVNPPSPSHTAIADLKRRIDRLTPLTGIDVPASVYDAEEPYRLYDLLALRRTLAAELVKDQPAPETVASLKRRFVQLSRTVDGFVQGARFPKGGDTPAARERFARARIRCLETRAEAQRLQRALAAKPNDVELQKRLDEARKRDNEETARLKQIV